MALRMAAMGWIGMKFGIDVHNAKEMNPNEFGDLLNFSATSRSDFSLHCTAHDFRIMYPNDFLVIP